MPILNKLITKETSGRESDILYTLPYEIPKTWKIYVLGEYSRLIINDDEELDWVHWVLLKFVRKCNEEITFSVLCEGEGPKSLREFRHIWFKTQVKSPEWKGYCFYLDVGLLRKAFDKLEEWFDFE